MDFEQLRIFLALAEERTLLGAANRLDTSRSRVRRKIDRLEAEAGTPLLIREAHGLQLTEAGESLARYGRVLLDDASHLIEKVREVGTEPTGTLRIAMPYAPDPSGWDAVCREAQARFPSLQLDLTLADVPESRLPSLADLALSFSEEAVTGCGTLEIERYPMRLVAGESYVAQHGLPDDLPEALRQKIAVWRAPNRDHQQIPLATGNALRITPWLVSNDPSRLYRAVATGDCLGYLPAFPSLFDPALKVLFPDQIAGEVRLRLFYPQVMADVPRVSGFLALLGPARVAPQLSVGG